MYPITIDQNRQDNIPTQHTFQVHMHHVCCPCSNVIYPYYPPGYRPPILAQPPPLPRPSYLHHYQYTQLHLNPAYNTPLPPQIPQHLTQNVPQSPTSTVDLAFGPPPRDRRNLENQEYEDQRTNCDKKPEMLQYPIVSGDGTYGLGIPRHGEGFMDLTASQVASLSTENYITYLVNGCLTGERIAKRNEHRPCFKNIQNLCNRTRSEVAKPNITVSNIHSQGVPWATKDFIFAFVRAINCWCILRGYLSSKEGNLGKIDKEISQEFRSCYGKWEKCTKQLTHYLIETFCKLDEINSPSNLNLSQTHSNPNASTSTSPPNVPTNRVRTSSPLHQETPKNVIAQNQTEITFQTVEKPLTNKEMMALKGVPGILHIPPASTMEFVETKNVSPGSTETSFKEEDSDSESRVYMKPGSYNVPTKLLSEQLPSNNNNNNNSPRSIEFLDTAQNVAVHHRKLEKTDVYCTEVLKDKAWQLAQNATPEFIKLNEESSVFPNQNQVRIENWLSNSVFECNLKDFQENENETGVLGNPGRSSNELTASPITNNDKEIVSWTYKNKRSNYGGEFRAVPKTFRRNSLWEYKPGGLTDNSIAIFEKFIKNAEIMDCCLHITFKLAYLHTPQENDGDNPVDLYKISSKLENKKYLYLYEVVHDFRHMMRCAAKHFTEAQMLEKLEFFRDKLDEMLLHEFPNVDFSTITGESGEKIGPLVKCQRGKATITPLTDGDGDH